MEKEKVLDIEVVKINDVWSVWYIKKINREILKNGVNDKFYIITLKLMKEIQNFITKILTHEKNQH